MDILLRRLERIYQESGSLDSLLQLNKLKIRKGDSVIVAPGSLLEQHLVRLFGSNWNIKTLNLAFRQTVPHVFSLLYFGGEEPPNPATVDDRNLDLLFMQEVVNLLGWIYVIPPIHQIQDYQLKSYAVKDEEIELLRNNFSDPICYFHQVSSIRNSLLNTSLSKNRINRIMTAIIRNLSREHLATPVYVLPPEILNCNFSGISPPDYKVLMGFPIVTNVSRRAVLAKGSSKNNDYATWSAWEEGFVDNNYDYNYGLNYEQALEDYVSRVVNDRWIFESCYPAEISLPSG